MKPKRIIIPESRVQKSILDYLKAMRIPHFRNNTGAAWLRGSFVRFGSPGSPDIIAAWRGHTYAIECKATNKGQEPAQAEFQRKFESQGWKYILARSLEDVRNVMETKGKT